MFGDDETGAPVRRREDAVLVQALPATARAGRKGPLLRAERVEQRIAQTADVEVTPQGALPVLCEDLLRVLVGKQVPGQWRRQSPAEAACEVDGDPPVMTRLARRCDGRHEMGDPPFRVGHRSLLFSPGGRRQQEVGKACGIGVGVGFLEDDEGCLAQGGANLSLRRQRLRRVGAGDPDRLDRAGPEGGKQLDGGFPRSLGHGRHAPETGDLGAVLRVGQVAVRREQVGEAANLAATHGVRLTGQRERAGAGAADLPGCQMQVDQRRVVVRAVG
jgi:hypothetical protein